MRKAFVLLSGGIDSTTCLHLAMRDFDEVEGVSIFYGQRHMREINHAKGVCDMLGVYHHVIDISNAMTKKSMLTNLYDEIPKVSYDQLCGVSPTYVPFRNGFMLSALASYAADRWNGFHSKRVGAEAGNAQEWAIFFGAHAEDSAGWAYPDCTPEFIGAMAQAIYIGTYRGIRLHTPLQWLTKREIILLGESLNVRWDLTWSCYVGDRHHCGECPTCRARRAGFKAAGIADPTVYAKAA